MTQVHVDLVQYLLMQRQCDGKFHPISYYSKTASLTESRLHNYELETLAIVYAIRRFHIYLQGLSFKIALNNSLYKSTGFSPSVLLFGVEQRGSVVDELTKYLDSKLNNINYDMTQNREIAYENICKAQETNLEQFSRGHKSALQFIVGDFVVIKNVDCRYFSGTK